MISCVMLLMSIVSVDVERSRSIVVPRSIERTLVRIGAGLVQSGGSEGGLRGLCQSIEQQAGSIQIVDPRIFIDGRREGWAFCRVARGLFRVGKFAAGCGSADDSVELRYRLLTSGLSIDRRVLVTPGRIVSYASLRCSLGPQGRCRAVRIRVDACEGQGGTTIVSAISAQVQSGICPGRGNSICRQVNRWVAGEVSRQLDDLLAEAEQTGRRWSISGHEALRGLLRCPLQR